MEPTATSETGIQDCPVETGLPETLPKPWGFSQQQGDRQLSIGVFQSCYGRGGSWPLQPGKLLSLCQLCPLHSVFTSFKQINLNREQRSWRWYLGGYFCSCFAFFPLSSEVKTRGGGSVDDFFHIPVMGCHLPPSPERCPSLWGPSIPRHFTPSAAASHEVPWGI